MTYKVCAGAIVAGLLMMTGGMHAAETVSTNHWRITSVQKIWEAGKHNAFTDLTRFQGQWFCTFREADAHVGGDGLARVLTSKDGSHWESAAGLTEVGIDLRDPKFSITPDNRLMLVMGGSVYEGKTFKGMQPRVSFSTDGRTWTKPQRVLNQGEWLWRVTWHNGTAYGLSYSSGGAPEWNVKLVKSSDGVTYETVTKLEVTGRPNEGTLRFLDNGECIALLRREAQDRHAWIGSSRPPYSDWTWKGAGLSVGGPNFIVLSDGRMVASGRQTPSAGGPKTFVGLMTRESVTPMVVLPSGGDTSYPGLVWHDGMLWVSYYSSHEGKSAIYLAKVEVPQR